MSARASVDPRIWNLAAVGAIAAGCGPGRGQLVVNDEPATEATIGTAPDTNTDPDDVGYECQSSADCPPAYYCFQGECRYEGYTDGHWPEYDCYDDEQCGSFELCEFNYCVPVPGARLDLCPASPLPIPEVLDVGELDNYGQVLALHFAELDGDGKDELVAVRRDGLRVYDVDAEAASLSPSQSPGFVASATGQLDGALGEDLLIVSAIGRQLYSSLGDGTFAAPTAGQNLLDPPEGVRVADFDTVAPLDQLVYGALGAKIELADGQLLDVLDVEAIVDRAAVHDRAQMFGGYALANSSQIWFFNFDHAEQASPAADLDGPLAALTALGTPYFVGVSWTQSWSTLRVWDASGTVQADYLHEGLLRSLLTAELDADGVPEWLVGNDSWLSIWRQPLSPGECVEFWPLDDYAGAIRRFAAGDYDGDGDDEVAFVTTLDEIVLLSP